MRPIPAPLNEPWAITREGLERVVDVYARARLGGEVFGSLETARAEWEARKDLRAEEPGDPIEGTGGTLRVINGVGVLGIRGTLFRHANLISDFSGGSTYDSLWRGLEAALNDASVGAILVRVDSPGGDVNGCGELAEALFRARERKPVLAYVEHLGASAAYWLASQCERIVAYETSLVGSIGVLTSVIDDSKAEETAGVREIEIVSSQSPGKRNKPVDDDVKARRQTIVDDLADKFVGAVARGRGVEAAKVLADFGQGDVLIAGKALAAGMIDELGDFNSTLAALAAEVQASAAAPSTFLPSAATGARAASKEHPMARSNKPSAHRAAAAPAESEKKQDDEAAEDDKEMGAEDKAPEDEKMDDKAEGEPDGDEKAEGDEDEKDKEHDEPDGDEGKAKASLAAMVGLEAGVSLRQIAAAAAAKLVPLTATTKVERENADLRARLEKLEEKEHTAAAELFVSKAIADGRTTEEKRAHLVAEYVRAEKATAGSGEKALGPQLFGKGTFTVGRRLTSNGRPLGKAEEKETSFAGDAPEDVERAVDAKVKEIAAAKKCSYGAAMDLLATDAPELHAQYKAITSPRRSR